MEYQVLVLAGFALVILGFLLVVVGSIASEAGAEAGGVIFIGPVPVVFGSNRDAALAAAVLGLVVLGLLCLLKFG